MHPQENPADLSLFTDDSDLNPNFEPCEGFLEEILSLAFELPAGLMLASTSQH